MMKTSESTKSWTRPKKGGVEDGGDSRAWHDGSKVDKSEIDDGEVDSNEVANDEGGKKVQKMSKSKNLFKFKKLSKSK